MLELKDRQIAAIKRQYKNSLPAIKKIESLNKKIADLIDERDREQAYLDGGEAGIKALTGGYASYELIKCEYIPQFNDDGTPKMDKDGKYQLKKQVLTFVQPTEPAMPDAGSDFDADACQCNSCECTPYQHDNGELKDLVAQEVAQMEAEKDYFNETAHGTSTGGDSDIYVNNIEFEKECLNSGVGVESANDNTSTEA